MNVLTALNSIRNIQRICGACARAQLVRAQPLLPVTCKYCGHVMPGKKTVVSRDSKPRETTAVK